METNVFFILFFCFVLLRFYLNNLNKIVKVIVSTCVIFGLCFAFINVDAIIYALLLSLSFGFVEMVLIKPVKGTAINQHRIAKKNIIFEFAINFSVVVVLYLVSIYGDNTPWPSEFIEDIFGPYGIAVNYNEVFRFLSIILFAIKPCNQIIQAITSWYKVSFKKELEVVNEIEISKDENNELSIVLNEEVKEKSDNKIGRLIGAIERLLIVVLLLNGLFTLIAVVLTAKTITRYNKISNDKEFAEVYLLGTLLSLLLVVCTYYILYVVDFSFVETWWV